MIRAALPALLALLAVGAAPAQEGERAPAEDRVTVTGQRFAADLEDLALDYVGELAAPELGARFGVPRWDGELCVSVLNLAEERAQFLIDAISQTAIGLGLRAGEPGCGPNLTIVFAPDGREAADAWVSRRRDLFRPWGGVGGTTPGLVALRKFRQSDAPVRWWHVTLPVDRHGAPAVALNRASDGVPSVQSPGMLLTTMTSDRIQGVNIVVDAGKVSAATWPQLADYLALVSLARIDPEAETGGMDTILNLFGAANPPSGLTEWDRAFLISLYEFDPWIIPGRQDAVIASGLARALRRAEE